MRKKGCHKKENGKFLKEKKLLAKKKHEKNVNNITAFQILKR